MKIQQDCCNKDFRLFLHNLKYEKGLEGKPTSRMTIPLIITTLKISMIPDEEVDSSMLLI